ncbi:MAG: zinc-dependent alcohol dehydrogenase family protein [Gammaproteobacteria bacterium]|nr:zinc-dependent alcohol dehydrogenase family protein [Gammaproteobacteria bacterium]
MQAIAISQSVSAEELVIQDLPKPEINSDRQVLVRLKAAGINPLDIKIRQNKQGFPVEPQAILGCDGAGIVEQTGSAVTAFKPGDAVFFCHPGLNGRQGTYAEYALVDQAVLAPKPEVLSFTQAAAIPLVLITAWEALFDRASLQSGNRVLVEAGAGGVGHIAVQLAVKAGARVATTVGSQQKADYLKQLGAEKIIFYRDQDVVDEIMQWTGQTGVDIAFDTIGDEVLQRCLSSTRCYGDVVTILTPTAETDWSEARLKNIRFSQELMLTPFFLNDHETMQHQSDILKKCTEDFNQSRLSVKVAKVFQLEHAGLAHQYLEQQVPIGKVVLEIN